MHYLNMSAPEDIVYNLILTILGFLGLIFMLGMCVIYMYSYVKLS